MKVSNRWRPVVTIVLLAAASATAAVHAQRGRGQAPGEQTKMTFVNLSNSANAVIAEPPATDPARSRIAILIAHPERLNTFNYFLGRELSKRGYRTMMMNYYGREQTYEEFLAPLAAAVRALRTLPGVEKVVFAGHSTGGAEFTFYQDVAENGAKACQGPERVYPCRGNTLANLPKADAIMMLDINIGAPLRTISLDPAVDSRRPRDRNPELDMFSSRNGFGPEGRTATYTADFTRRFFAAQRARNVQVIGEALARLAKIEKGEGEYKDDEPFVVAGSSLQVNGARLDLADRRLLSKTRAPHPFLKADGTTATDIVPSVLGGAARAEDTGRLDLTTQVTTVRHYLSFLAMRTTPDYALTDNNITGIEWRSSANSAPGNIEGITAPTLVMAGTCAAHLVPSEITFDHAAAKDKQFVAVEGADHDFQPCQPQYGDTAKRAFDYVDGWLTKPGRF
jgi:pimeloyl-ACP methyl ester carboxylesterase